MLLDPLGLRGRPLSDVTWGYPAEYWDEQELQENPVQAIPADVSGGLPAPLI